MTVAEVDAIFKATGGCAGCGVNERLVIDHDHVTGAFRGVLCSKCNVVLGLVKDNPFTLRHLAQYLQQTVEVARVDL